MTPHIIAAEALKRIQARPCECQACVISNNLPAILRILEAAKEHYSAKKQSNR